MMTKLAPWWLSMLSYSRVYSSKYNVSINSCNILAVLKIIIQENSRLCLFIIQVILKIRWYIKIHYNNVIMSAMASQITSLTIVYSTVYSGINQRKHGSSASLAFVRGIHRWPVNSLHKGPVTRKMFPCHNVIMFPLSFFWCREKYCLLGHVSLRVGESVAVQQAFFKVFPDSKVHGANIWGPPGADRTQVSHMLDPRTWLSGLWTFLNSYKPSW